MDWTKCPGLQYAYCAKIVSADRIVVRIPHFMELGTRARREHVYSRSPSLETQNDLATCMLKVAVLKTTNSRCVSGIPKDIRFFSPSVAQLACFAHNSSYTYLSFNLFYADPSNPIT